MLNFSYKILNFDDDRIDLKNKLIFNEERKLMYGLRNKDLLFEPGIKSKYGTNTFEYIYSRLINKFDLSFNHFKLPIFNNINLIYAKTLKKFDQVIIISYLIVLMMGTSLMIRLNNNIYP
ncbi:hypothetical protein BpHYR1_040402 [Brachionus plicatilis]|uniref:Uncharacterized protein n=1 Tax=Brachionus plicatilis TaxID=10195 RepID=A0A3M7QQI3_BRAPC|nr:hypothetical protein BpHYR1_040402 [Brachionus plicatilis]